MMMMDEDFSSTNGLMAEDTMTVLPGLMQNQREKYGPMLFHKDDRGFYTCFFRGCGKQLQANFSRHIARHEMDNDEIDPIISSQLTALSYKQNPTTPMQQCSHTNHEIWWGTDPELPITEFYNRSSKCKKCYIRQQQESKKARLKDPNYVGTGSPIVVTPNKAMGSVMITPIATRQSNSTPYKPTPNPPPASTAFFTNAPNAPGTSLVATTPFILSRPPREINRKHFNAVLMKRLKGVITTLMEHPDSWPFNQPVDVIKLGLKDYYEVIKKPMDLRTISENMDGGKYTTPAQFADDVRLVWHNARTYNKIESEIYDFASNLSVVFEELYKKTVADTEAEAKSEAEMEQPSDICAICGTGSQHKAQPVPTTPAKAASVTPAPVTAPSTPASAIPAPATPIPAPATPAAPTASVTLPTTPGPSSAAPSTPAVSTPAPAASVPSTPAPAIPTPANPAITATQVPAPVIRPLLHCDGSCLRAFHASCLGLTEIITPWLCNECRNGKPVLHWDPAKHEYFYYYYEATPETEIETGVQDKVTFGKPSAIGMLPEEGKRKLRDEEEAHRLKEMYYDALWCMWRCKSRDIVRQREERQKPLLKELEGGDEEEHVVEKKQRV